MTITKYELGDTIIDIKEACSLQRLVSRDWFVFDKQAPRNTENNWAIYAGPFATRAEAREWRDKQPANKWMTFGRMVIEVDGRG